MICFVNNNTGCSDTIRRIDPNFILKVILSLILYAVFECVISDENELHNKRTNEYPNIFFEYGDYIFVIASTVCLSISYESGIKTRILKFIHEFWVCVICTNIALTVIWTQLIEFTSIFCTHLSKWLAKLHSQMDFDLIQIASVIVKSETCARVLLTAIALLMFFFVFQSANLVGYTESLNKKAQYPVTDCGSPKRKRNMRKCVQKKADIITKIST